MNGAGVTPGGAPPTRPGHDVAEPLVTEPALDEREALRQSIEDDTADLMDAVDELKTAVQSQFTLRARIAERPLPWLVGALCLGLWLGGRGRNRD